MEIRQIRFFLSIARAGSFSVAAVKLGVPQPMLSRQLQRLEEEIGASLFHRDGRGAQLSAAGETFLDYATAIIETTDQAMADLLLQTRSPTGGAVLGMPPSAGRILSIPFAQALGQSYPRMALRIVEGFSGHVLEWLQSGQLDLALLYEAAMRPTLFADPVLDEDLYCFGAPEDIIRIDDGSETLPFARIAKHALILPSRPHGLRIYLDQVAKQCDLSLRVALEVDALHTTFEAARARIGLAIMPRSAMADGLLAGTLMVRKIVDPVLTRTLFLATGPKRPTFATQGQLLKLMKTVIIANLDRGSWRMPLGNPVGKVVVDAPVRAAARPHPLSSADDR